ncbi:MAG: class I SAM-dependent methyltransferase [Betaproteobacteria bacterium]|nr:class I SAM-dependent methyltransferase [Betaproteobacteria bacterium]
MLAKALERVLGTGKRARTPGSCPVCGHDKVAFAPLPASYGKNARRHGFVHFGYAEMTSLDTYTCTHCGATDRERLYSLWIMQEIKKQAFAQGARFIHFAPEKALSKQLGGLGVFDYKTADLLMSGVDYKVNMMELPFEDESFDFFLCSHVLEHVPSDDRAIAELYRVTRRGGRGILMAPIALNLDRTIEDPNITDAAGRWRFYGQDDHVRLYAHDDYVEKIRGHGFRVDELGEQYFGPETYSALGLKSTSVLYVASK